MEIKYHGKACFSIREGKTTLVTDPSGAALGANLVTVSRDVPGQNETAKITGNPKILDWPGEYEEEGIYLRGIHALASGKKPGDKEMIIFVLRWGNFRLCHLGALAEKLTEEQLQQIGDVDLLFVPVGDGALEPKAMKEMIEEIDPRVTIPMALEGSLEPLLAVLGAKSTEPLPSFTVKKSELPEDSSKIVVLSA